MTSLPFLFCYVELYFILASVWMGQYYYVFGHLLLQFSLVMMICGGTAILFNYVQLGGENYHWWWRSFLNAGSISFWVLLYSPAYFLELEAYSVASGIVFFGVMAVVSLGVFLIAGSVGLLACLCFNKILYGSIVVGDCSTERQAGTEQPIIDENGDLLLEDETNGNAPAGVQV